MDILHVYKDFFPVVGGIENHLLLLTTELSRLPGMRVEVLVTNTSRRTTVEQMGSVKVTKAGRLLNLGSTPISLALFREIARSSYDAVHLHFPYPPGEMAALLWGRTRRLFITYHSDVVRQKGILRFYHPLLLRVLSRADAIIASSPNYIESSPYLSKFRDKCTVIPFGVDVSVFRPARSGDPRSLAMEDYPPPYILFLGKFRYYKGLHYLVEAMSQVAGGTLVLVGSGPEEASLRALVSRLGLGKRVVFSGQVLQDRLPEVYRDAHVFVLPSCERAEAFGIVQLEAMASGLPVVSTEVGTGTSFVNRHGETGLVVPHSHPGALADALNLLLTDDSLRLQMGRAARQRVEEQFTKEQMVARTVTLYQEMA